MRFEACHRLVQFKDLFARGPIELKRFMKARPRRVALIAAMGSPRPLR
jgi:hypothetical protein